MNVSPTGAVHEVGLEDMFFSTTDRRGVIDEANEVFVRLARRQREELLGAPHNIIRHPSMPGGIFRLLWGMVLGGEATCGYIVNLGGDGSAYWTMATIIPAGDGFISVRSRPCCTDMVGLAAEVYELVRQHEASSRRSGHGAAAAAMIGEEMILKEFANRGYDSYQAFVREALPAELETRVTLSGGLPDRPAATGPLRTMLDAVRDVEDRLRATAVDLADMRTQADTLRRHLDGAMAGTAGLAETLQQARQTVTDLEEPAPLLVNAGKPLHDRCTSVGSSLSELSDRVSDLAESRAALRFSVAMAQMQAEMLGRYAIALIDGVDDASSGEAIGALVAALEHGLHDVAQDLQRDSDNATALRAELDRVGSALKVTRMAMGKWRKLITQEYQLEDEMAVHTPALDHALNRTGQEITALTKAANGFAAAGSAFDLAAVEADLTRVRQMRDVAV